MRHSLNITKSSLLAAGLIFILILTVVEVKANYLHGKLPNGLTYYINQNRSAETVSFYLVEKAGSLYEEDRQSGLAHFIEHLAFNGTKNFPGKEIITYLESNGVEFGPDLNAVTSFDKTLFRIENVKPRTQLIDSCLLILKDWASDIVIEPEEVDAERKVITAEWRATDSSQKRIRQILAKNLLSSANPYTYKTPIGDINNINSFDISVLEDFYETWYQPQFQAIIVEGNIEPEEILKKINQVFDYRPLRLNHKSFSYPETGVINVPKATYAFDSELTQNSLDIQFLHPDIYDRKNKEEIATEDFSNDVISSILAMRLRQKAASGTMPYRGANAYMNSFAVASNIPAFTVGANFGNTDISMVLDSLCAEIVRVDIYGFSQEEFEQQKMELKRRLNYFNNSDSLNEKLSPQFIENFHSGFPVVTGKEKAKILENYLNTVSLSGLNCKFKELINKNGENTIIIVRGNDNFKKIFPEPEILEDHFIRNKTVDPGPFIPVKIQREIHSIMDTLPAKGKVIEVTHYDNPEIERWNLSNGANVYISSDGKDDEIKIVGIRRGGFSEFDIDEYPNFSVLTNVSRVIGLGDLSYDILKNSLAGRNIQYSINVDELTNKFTGRASREEAESLFQILYLCFTSPGKDIEMYEKWKENYKNSLEERANNRFLSVSDSISRIIYGESNPYQRIPELPDIEKINYDKIIELYKSLFGNATEFQFFIVSGAGNKDLQSYIETYIATLPASDKKEEKNRMESVEAPNPFKGNFKVAAPLPEGSANVSRTIMTQTENTLKNRLVLSILKELLRNIFLKDIRENLGAAYNINVEGDLAKSPDGLLTLNISVATSTEFTDLLPEYFENGLKALTNLEDTSILTGIKNRMKNDFHNYETTSDYIMNVMQDKYFYGDDSVLRYDEIMETIDIGDIRKMAEKLETAPSIIDVIYLPDIF